MWRPKQRHIDEGEVHSLLYKHSWMDDSLVDYDDTKVTFFSGSEFLEVENATTIIEVDKKKVQ